MKERRTHDLLHVYMCVLYQLCILLLECVHEYQKQSKFFLLENLKMTKSPLTQYKDSFTEQYASGMFLRGLNDKLKLVFSLQFLPANVSKTRSSQQAESFLLHWIAVWPKDDFNQGKGEYERVLQEKRWQSCQCRGFLVS